MVWSTVGTAATESYSTISQLEESLTVNQDVAGSSPAGGVQFDNLERLNDMIFEIETMEPTHYKIGSIHTVMYWNAGKPIQRTGRVIAHKLSRPIIAHKLSRPTVNMVSFARVVFDDLK